MTKVVLLAGGLGTRLAEETEVRPKPMVEVGEYPILWHIMKSYGYYGFNEFYVALGYKGEAIKRFFLDYYSLQGSMTLDIKTGEVKRHDRETEEWRVHLLETGQSTQTGGRIKRLQPVLGSETFMLTYGDGVCSANLQELLRFHRRHGKIATLTAVRPPARFGGLILNDSLVYDFTEKPQIGEGWINGGFMVLEPNIFDYISGDDCVFERDVLEVLSKEGQLAAYQHEGFWQCMDTLRDKNLLNQLWHSGNAPWKSW
jgi:glucose-1-phosphate cytidylyltransferase